MVCYRGIVTGIGTRVLIGKKKSKDWEDLGEKDLKMREICTLVVFTELIIAYVI